MSRGRLVGKAIRGNGGSDHIESLETLIRAFPFLFVVDTIVAPRDMVSWASECGSLLLTWQGSYADVIKDMDLDNR